VSDVAKRRGEIACPGCQTSMREIMRLAPLGNEPGRVSIPRHKLRVIKTAFSGKHFSCGAQLTLETVSEHAFGQIGQNSRGNSNGFQS
jgi:hypothetical protein